MRYLERWVAGPKNETLDARADVVGQSLILHSRGGATGGRPPRNTQYEIALLEICRRGQPDCFKQILIDSEPARALPEEQRILLTEEDIRGLPPADLAREIRSRLRAFGQPDGAKGGNSTKRVRFDVQFGTISQIFRLRKDPPASADRERLSADQLRRVKSQHIRDSVARLLAGEQAANFSPSRDYDLLTDGGARLAPKQVFGLALEEALGIEAFPHHFSAGWGTPCFVLLEAAGYTIVPKGSDDPREVAKILSDIEDEEARRFAEGSIARAKHLKRERNGKLIAAFKADFLLRNGHFFCEKCEKDWIAEYGEEVASACFEAHHAAVQVSEMPPGHESVIEDLELLCANCHRAEHRRMKLAAGG